MHSLDPTHRQSNTRIEEHGQFHRTESFYSVKTIRLKQFTGIVGIFWKQRLLKFCFGPIACSLHCLHSKPCHQTPPLAFYEWTFSWTPALNLESSGSEFLQTSRRPVCTLELLKSTSRTTQLCSVQTTHADETITVQHANVPPTSQTNSKTLISILFLSESQRANQRTKICFHTIGLVGEKQLTPQDESEAFKRIKAAGKVNPAELLKIKEHVLQERRGHLHMKNASLHQSPKWRSRQELQLWLYISTD